MAAAEYGSGLFDLCSDFGLTLYTCFCFECQNAINWSKVRGDQKCGLEHLCCPVSPYWTRQFIRSRKHMKKEMAHDCMCLCCCMPCAVIQDSKELNNGFGIAPSTEYFFGDTQQNLINK